MPVADEIQYFSRSPWNIGAGAVDCGHARGLVYSGDSRIIDPWGEILAAAAGGETMLLADLKPAAVQDARDKFPVLEDRRQ